ncbi:MAG TPA: helix-turn-helix domain-containing protein, partial [Propionibacteriaceae bacterium]|nr:helix-turn-helix domain-containing protein [Propionibacteriaceae bacterium]
MSGKGYPVVGDERQLLAKDLAERYTEGESIRSLAESTGHGRRVVRGLLVEAGVRLRRGGYRGARPAASDAQLVATLAARHRGQRLSGRQA